MPSLAVIENRVIKCTRCPELRSYCAGVAAAKRKAFAAWKYWGMPVPSFGDRSGKIMIVGLAPAAHGANRTGRMFTGDRSGDFLFAALYRAGLANQPTATSAEDGLTLEGVYITAAARCAPPANKPSPAQLQRCSDYLIAELRAMNPRAVICLGGIAWNAALAAMQKLGMEIGKPRPKFGHGVEIHLSKIAVIGCYHVSQQNTFTGRLTAEMLDGVLARARSYVR